MRWFFFMMLFSKKVPDLIFLWLFLLSGVYAFKYGAPPYACMDPTPVHGAPPQKTLSPFILSTEVIDSENGTVKIRIHSRTNSTTDTFTGYLVQLKDIAPFEGQSTGAFTIDHADGTVFACQRLKTSAITHDTNSKKRVLDIKWQTPPGFSGEVVFTSTIVVNYTHFWTNVESSPVKVKRAEIEIDDSWIADTASLQKTLLRMPKGCGVKKNCLSFPEDCMTNNSCNALLTIARKNGVYEIEMFSNKAVYVAMGLSHDFNMGADAITECVLEETKVEAYLSWNVPRRKTNKRLPEQRAVHLVRGLFQDDILYCKVELTSEFEIDGYKFNLDKNWYYMTLASGRDLLEGKPGIAYHDRYRVSPTGRYFLSAIALDPEDDLFYENCGNGTICHGVPGACVATRNCRFAVKVGTRDHRFVVSLLTHNSMYAAVGFTEDQRRGNDHIVECLTNNTDVQTWRSWNIPDVFDNLRMGQTGLELLSGKTLKNNGLQCTVLFDPSVIPSFKLDLKYYLILAGGSTLMDRKVGYHNLARSINDENIGLYTEQGIYDRYKLFYNECGVSRTCMGYPSGCIDGKYCEYAVSIASDNVRDIYSFHIIGDNSAGYVAIGLSEDEFMGDDLVIDCKNLENHTAKASLSFNGPGKTNKPINAKLQAPYFMPTYGAFDGERLECIALLEHPHFKLENKSFDLLNTKYYLMMAVGKRSLGAVNGTNGTLSYHNVIYEVSSEPHLLGFPKKIEQYASSKAFIYVHGVLMIVTWIVLGNLSTVVARHFKNVWTNSSSPFGHWLKWHQRCMILALVFTYIGLVSIYIYCGKLITIADGYSVNHAIYGYFTFILMHAQVVTALLSPPSDGDGTLEGIMFKIYQWLTGYALNGLAIVALFLAVGLTKTGLPYLTYYILSVYVIHFLGISSLLSITDKVLSPKKCVTVAEENDMARLMNNELMKQSSDKCKNVLFFYHLIITSAIALVLIGMVLYYV